MKIALVVHDFDPGFGQGRYAVELARRIGPRHDVHVYANRFAVGLEPNITFQKVPAARASALLTILTFMRAAETLLRRRRYDVIHAQGVTCWRANVITAHVCNAARSRGGSGETRKSRLFATLAAALERRFYRANRHATVIGVSHAVAEEVRREYGLPTAPLVVHHGIDAAQFRAPLDAAERASARRLYGLPQDAWVWLFAGEAAKGLPVVLRQLAAFPEARLLVISRSDLAPFRRQAAVLQVDSRVCFHGPERRMWSAYHAADVFVYPSAYDAFGMVVAEAMASELPVIAGRNIGAAEWIEHGKNGLLCDPASERSLRECLERVKGDRAFARSLGTAARRAAEQHSWDACARATLAACEQAARARSNS